MSEENQSPEVEVEEEKDDTEPEIEEEKVEPQYYADFDESGNIAGFFLNEIHGDNIPETAIPITYEQWQEMIEDSNKYKLDGDTIREKTQQELDAEEAERPKPPPSRVETLETENAELWYEVMLEKSRNDNHDADIAQLYYEMMMGGVGA